MPGTATIRRPVRSDVAQRARIRLRERLNMAVQTIWCEYEEGVLVLQGRLPSYYLKQLAQESVARLDGVRRIVNEIKVVAP